MILLDALMDALTSLFPDLARTPQAQGGVGPRGRGRAVSGAEGGPESGFAAALLQFLGKGTPGRPQSLLPYSLPEGEGSLLSTEVEEEVGLRPAPASPPPDGLQGTPGEDVRIDVGLQGLGGVEWVAVREFPVSRLPEASAWKGAGGEVEVRLEEDEPPGLLRPRRGGDLPSPAAVTAPPGPVDRSPDHLVPELQARLRKVMARMEEEFGHTVEVVEGYRAPERQEALYRQGRSEPGPVVTWTRESLHSEGRAVDLRVDGSWENPEGYAHLQRVAQEEGLRTLGARDPGHVELPDPGGVVRGVGQPSNPGWMDELGSWRSGHEPASRLAPSAPVARAAGVAHVAHVAQVARAGAGAVRRIPSVAASPTAAEPEEGLPVPGGREAPPALFAPAPGDVAPAGGEAPGGGSEPAPRLETARSGEEEARVRPQERGSAPPLGTPPSMRNRSDIGSRARDPLAPPRPMAPIPVPVPGPESHDMPAERGGLAASTSAETMVPAPVEGSTLLGRPGGEARRDGRPSRAGVGREASSPPSADATSPSLPQGSGSTSQHPPLLHGLEAGSSLPPVGPMERVNQVQALEEALDSRLPGRMHLELEDVDGAGTRLRLELRGTQLDGSVGLSDPAAALRMRTRIGELHEALSRRGLDARALEIQGSAGTSGRGSEMDAATLIQDPLGGLARLVGTREGGSDPRTDRGWNPRDETHRESGRFRDPARRDRSKEDGR